MTRSEDNDLPDSGNGFLANKGSLAVSAPGERDGSVLAEASGPDTSGSGLALPGLIVGLLTGAAVYGIVEYWIDGNDAQALPITVLFFVVTTAGAYLLLAETDKLFSAVLAALGIGAIMTVPDYFMAGNGGDETKNLTVAPVIFWFSIGRTLSAYLLTTLVKACLEDGAPPPYRAVFFHGLTIPLIAAGAKLFAGLALVLLFAWAALLKSLDVDFFNRLFQEPWFIFPFLGAIGGLSIAMMRGQQAVLGALRFVLLLFCRIAMPITAVSTIILVVIFIAKGVGVVFDLPAPSLFMIAIAFAGMLIFNGVYQNGEGAPPPAWLRLATIISLLGFPIYAGLAFHAFSLRIEEYGLTPMRIWGFAFASLAAAYSVVCLAGLVTEINWRSRRWMPLVAPLNTLMTVAWIVVVIALATPFLNPWAMSAKSQYQRIADNRVTAEEFDFGYLRFQLGEYGDRALEDLLALSDHPEADDIRMGVERARGAKSYWEYQNADLINAIESGADESADGPMSLEFNPANADTGPDDPDGPPPDDG